MAQMTVTEVKNFLNGKRVFVGAHSAQIQQLAFAVGYLWGKDPMDVVKHLDKPFLFFTIKENGAWIKSTLDLAKFNNSSKQLVTAEELLDITIKDVVTTYVTPEEYIANHRHELKEEAEARSISEAIREKRFEDLPKDFLASVLSNYCVSTSSVGVVVPAYVNSSCASDDDDLYNQGYTDGYVDGYDQGYTDSEEGVEYDPSID